MPATCKAVKYVGFYGGGGELGARGKRTRVSTIYSGGSTMYGAFNGN